MRPILLALVLVLAGCARSSFDTCSVTCGPSGSCPSGLSCDTDDNFCKSDLSTTCTGVDVIDGGMPDASIDGGGEVGSAEFIVVSTGLRSSCGIRADRSLWCWGGGDFIALGDGNSLRQAAPVRVGSETDWLAVAVGNLHTCGLRGSALPGTLWCWGDNEQRRVVPEDELTDTHPLPVPVNAPAVYQSLTANDHTCAIDGDGELWCWGANDGGQIGNGTAPVPPESAQLVEGAGWTRVSAGGLHTCGIQAGALYCWGDDTYDSGRLGIQPLPAEKRFLRPERVGNQVGWVDVAAGDVHTCGVRAGELYCWGSNAATLGNGQIGGNQMTPLRIGTDTDWKRVSAAPTQSCGIRGEAGGDRLYCWGLNEAGQLGDGSRRFQTRPTLVVGEHLWKHIDVGVGFACGLDSTDALRCWGDDSYGQAGDGRLGTEASPVQIGSGALATGWTEVNAGERNTCALHGDELYCWGSNDAGQLQQPIADRADSRIPLAMTAGSSTWRSIGVGANHMCGVAMDGALYCWGNNRDGQLGRGSSSTTPLPTPAKVQAERGMTWSQASAAGQSSCAIDSTGQLFCFGENYAFELGMNQDNAPYNAPTQVGAASDWTHVVLAADNGCGLRGPGELYCWGLDGYGQLGNGGEDGTTSVPLEVDPTSKDWVSVDFDALHVCARRGVDLGRCWGRNGAGELGDGTADTATLPIEPMLVSSWKSLSAGGEHTCGVSGTGNLRCWGSRDFGEGGDGMASPQPEFVPREVGSATDWASVSMGDRHACALKTDGSLWCWGQSRYGQVGNGQGSTTRPTRIVDPE